jgi:choice-of-anchor B domain-containing protein
MQQNFFWSSEQALPKLLVMLLVLAAPLRAQEFGAAVAIGADEILIGEPLNQRRASTIYRYRQSADGWEQTGTMTAPTPVGRADYFGRFIAMDDRSLLIGGTLYENSTGTVWSYSREGADWQFDVMVQPDSLVEGEAFGRFGQLYDNMFFVSSLGFGGVGAVWVFERDETGAWVERAVLQPEAPAPQEFFGWGLDYNGERLIVGSFAGEGLSGAAYVFSRDDEGAWYQEVRLALAEGESQPGDVGAPGRPGSGTIGVGWFQGMALLGLPGRDGAEGTVYTFTRSAAAAPASGSTGDWVRGATLTAFDRRPNSYFGHLFHDRGSELWVSAPGAGGRGGIYRFFYDADTGVFREASTIGPSIDVDLEDRFGATVATAGDLAIIGQPGDDEGLGSAMVMREQAGYWASESKLLIPGTPGLPAISGGEVACGESGTADQFGCSRVDILSFLPTAAIGGTRGIGTNDVWGWTDPQTGREYAIVGRSNGTSFVDISDPTSPVYLGSLRKTPGSLAASWRDMKVFDNHVFVVADGAGQHGMQVFDLTRLRAVDGAPAAFLPDALYQRIASVHNIAINESTGIAYALGSGSGGETCGGGLHMIDINDPTEPTFVGCFQDNTTGRAGTGYTHDAQCVIYQGPDAEHVGREICFGSNETALSIADVTDKDNPISISIATYPDVAYAHQGWLTEDQRYFFLSDELDELSAQRDSTSEWEGARTMIWDVADLDDPILAKEHFGEVFSSDHNLYIKGNLMYQSNYTSGLRILDVSDPLNPFEVGFLDTVPRSDSPGFGGSWSNYPFFESGTIVVSSGREGVFFLRYRPLELL